MKLGDKVRVLVTEDLLGSPIDPNQPYELSKRMNKREWGIAPYRVEAPGQNAKLGYMDRVVNAKSLELWDPIYRPSQ